MSDFEELSLSSSGNGTLEQVYAVNVTHYDTNLENKSQLQIFLNNSVIFKDMKKLC